MTSIAGRRNRAVAWRAALFGLAMLGLAFASVPLYRIFCQVTGFGGTTMRADAAPGAVAGEIGVRFDANIVAALPWKFEPEQDTRPDPPGRAHDDLLPRSNYHRAHDHRAGDVQRLAGAGRANISARSNASASPNRRCKPGESVRMPVVFFVDPKLRTDPATRDIDEITLSYTFYPVEKPARGG